jgi:uncharacterized protein (DUF58 family)
MEFEEVREYAPGDDIRAIDWNVTARTGKPFIKHFREERELTVMFLVDLSASGSFGSTRQLKNEVAAEICALLAFAAIKNSDKVGLIVFTDQVERFIPPGKGTRHVLRVIRDILSFSPRRGRTDIARALDYLGRVQTRRAVVFLISDFQAEDFERSLRVVGRRHDLIAVSVSDPREMELPPVGLIQLEDAETGETVLLDTGSARVREEYARRNAQARSLLQDLFRSVGVDEVHIQTGKSYILDLVKFFKNRERRR